MLSPCPPTAFTSPTAILCPRIQWSLAMSGETLYITERHLVPRNKMVGPCPPKPFASPRPPPVPKDAMVRPCLANIFRTPTAPRPRKMVWSCPPKHFTTPTETLYPGIQWCEECKRTWPDHYIVGHQMNVGGVKDVTGHGLTIVYLLTTWM